MGMFNNMEIMVSARVERQKKLGGSFREKEILVAKSRNLKACLLLEEEKREPGAYMNGGYICLYIERLRELKYKDRPR